MEALDTLREIDDVNLIAIPDRITAPVQQALIAHCEQLADRFAVLDAQPPQPDQPLFGPGSIEEQRLGVDSTRGYAALYYPWLRVAAGRAGRTDPGSTLGSRLRDHGAQRQHARRSQGPGQ